MTLALRDDTDCPVCGGAYLRATWEEPPLPGLRSGYGEARRLTVEVCWCRVREVERSSIRAGTIRRVIDDPNGGPVMLEHETPPAPEPEPEPDPDDPSDPTKPDE